MRPERDVRPLVPDDPGALPVEPEVAHLIGGNQPVADPPEDVASLARELRLDPGSDDQVRKTILQSLYSRWTELDPVEALRYE